MSSFIFPAAMVIVAHHIDEVKISVVRGGRDKNGMRRDASKEKEKKVKQPSLDSYEMIIVNVVIHTLRLQEHRNLDR